MNKKKKLKKLVKSKPPTIKNLLALDPTKKIYTDTVRTSVRIPKPILSKLKTILVKKNYKAPVKLSLNSILVHSLIQYASKNG
jgi:hypothetical protein